MYFLNTEMHIVTFCITVFEIVMLLFQGIYYLQRTSDKKRLLYFILLLLMVLYNLTSGLFPDEQFLLPIMVQNGIAYLAAFATSMYFVYYFYKAFELIGLRFFVRYGIIIFLLLPFLLLFLLPYYLTGNLVLSRQLTVVIPFLYGIAFITATTRSFIIKHKESKRLLPHIGENRVELIVAAYIALICWATLPVIVFFGDFQVLEHSITNAGFLMLTLIYIKTSIIQSRWEYRKLVQAEQNRQQALADNYLRFGLTAREIDVVNLLMKGHPYKVIADLLHISEKTVARHISNSFLKTSASNKVELINKLESKDE